MRAIYRDLYDLLQKNKDRYVGDIMKEAYAIMKSPIIDVFKHRSMRPLDTERWLISAGFNAQAYDDGSVLILGRSLKGNPHYRCWIKDQQWLICMIREDGQLWIERYDTLTEAERYLRSIGEPDYILSKRSNRLLHEEEDYLAAKARYKNTHDHRGLPL